MTAAPPRRRSNLFKPEYAEAASRSAPFGATAAPTLDDLRALERRILDAMLTLDVDGGERRNRLGAGFPDFLVEFSDKVGQESKTSAWKARFTPSAAQIDDMLPALELLQGLRSEYFELIWDRAVTEHYGGKGAASWEALGKAFGRSETWAKQNYQRAMLQAARRAGLLSQPAEDFAVVCVAIISEGMFFTWTGTSGDPKQTLYDLRAKNALGIADAFALWTPGKPVAKRLLQEARDAHVTQLRHGAWIACNPFDFEQTLLERAEAVGASWRLDYLG